MQKRGPAILLTLLFIILVFIVGVRYGQRVEKTNKNVSYLLSITPTKVVPTESALEFRTYANQACGVQFLYPNSFDLKETSQSAQLNQNSQTKLAVSCEKTNPFIKILQTEKIATQQITLQNRRITAQTFQRGQNTYFIFNQVNPLSRTTIYFLIEKTLYPLFDSSLKFQAPNPK